MNKGFSFIELLSVLAIVGILTIAAYPHYADYILRAHRLDGQTSLWHLANLLEDYHKTHGSYQGATVLNFPHPPSEWYTLSIIEANDTQYLIQATPSGPQIEDRQCQSLTLSSTGLQGIAAGPRGNPKGTIKTCWPSS